ncbi:hypothetical protein [uncultured Psychroserpens sp.]|uniref:tetratricopeptide repeat protein n=1 Tax=uncultured Psychroserpens sp. TaxID=255436 RepID=UPI00263143C1|nr:hypothetical protein [uncultured Psychroserpens sp.]
MVLKKLSLFFSLVIICNTNAISQENIKTVLQDTVSYNEENTQKIIEFANQISQAIHSYDDNAFIAKLNKDRFFDRILNQDKRIDPNDDFVKGFMMGMEEALNSFPNEIITDVRNGSYYDFISYRYDTDDQTYYALFRLYSAEAGMNYHDYRIYKKDGEIQFSDMYIYLSGEHFTETLGRMLAFSLPQDKIFGVIKTSRDAEVEDIYKAFLYNSNGEFQKSYDIIDGLKSDLGKEKFLLIFKSLVATNIGEKEYLKSLEDIINTFPDDPTIYLNKIDYHVYKEEYYEAIQTINQLQNETEDDFLNYLKACIAFEDQNYDMALNFFEYTKDNYPDFFEGQAGYLNTLVMMKNYADAVKYLDVLVEEGYEKSVIVEYVEEDDEFGENILEDLVKSKDFKIWKRKKTKN